jgi:predicted nucleotidyltransferase
MNAFITGSRAYGTTKPNSDIDLVIRVDEETAKILQLFSESKTAVRFGKVNLILCTTDEEYAVWLLGTMEMKESVSKPFDKVAAKEIFDELRARVGVKDKAQSGKEEEEDGIVKEKFKRPTEFTMF